MQTSEVASKIASLYAGLRKINSYSPEIIAKIINFILLDEGLTRQDLSQAWEEWYRKKGLNAK